MSDFVRSLGHEPGTQLAPIKDQSGGAGSLGVWDQIVAVAMRAARGRIDKPFRVNVGNFGALLGNPGSIAVAAINEAYAQGYEALRRGARELLVQRLVPAGATVKWVTWLSAASSTWAVAASAPTADFTLAFKHKLCHNDGIKAEVHAPETADGSGSAVATKLVTVVVRDSTGLELHRITGSLDPAAVDGSGLSLYLPDVSERELGDVLEWAIASAASVGTTHDAYGRSSGADKWSRSGVLAAFVEGGTTYADSVYQGAATKLSQTTEPFGYIISGGSTASVLLTALEQLAFDTNRQFLVTVPGNLTPAAAITWVQQLGFGSLGRDHYVQFYWSPFKALDPKSGNLCYLGTEGMQAGYRCARNAVVNAYGLAAKQNPVAGQDYPVVRSGIVMQYTPNQYERSDLAKAGINPVIPVDYAGGRVVVVSDCLTSAAANDATSYRKLVATAEMSAHLDEEVVRICNDARNLTIDEAVNKARREIEARFKAAKSSGWLVDGKDLSGDVIPAWELTVKPNPASPSDSWLVAYALHYPGTSRRAYVSQTIN